MRPPRRAKPIGGPRPVEHGERSIREVQAPDTIKLQKLLANAGLGSRRAMEELITSGEVTVNGERAKLGARVSQSDRILVRGEPLGERREKSPLPRVIAYHKPEGEIVSRDDPEGRPSVFDRVGPVRRGRWLTIGRLDFNTCGLLLFTDSGDLANHLMHPRFGQEREYAVRVFGELSDEQLQRLRTGVMLEDGMARCEHVELQGGEGANRWVQLVVREGRNRLVRRLFEALGLTVSRLMRTRFGPFTLPPRLLRGRWLELDPDTVARSLTALGLPPVNAQPARQGYRDRPRPEPMPRGARGAKRR